VQQTTGSADCPACGGTGLVDFAVKYLWTNGQREIIEAHQLPPYSGDMFLYEQYPGYKRATEPCQCVQATLAARRMARILGDPDIPDDCYRFAFDDFAGLDYAALALDYARQLAVGLITDADGLEKPGLLIVGPTGTGKTTLSSLVFRARVETGVAGGWTNVNRLFKMIRATYDDDYSGPSQNNIIAAIEDVDFLMLDDLGSVTKSQQGKANGLYFEDAIEAIRSIADHRLVKRKPTIITTNLNKEQLYAQFGDRVVSRLRGLCHVATMIGGDFRAPGDRIGAKAG
jgi:DNA replication protein DnaC